MTGGFTIGGRYDLEALPHGRGGMGQVYFGADRVLGRRVAVKFIMFRDGGYDPKLVERFRGEAKLTAGLEHPGVPAIYDVGVHEGRPYLVMQAIDGITLADLIAEQGQLPLGWAAAIGAQICAVLAAAHRAGLVHRDLKPANFILEPDGWVKVLDFGLALDVDDSHRLTSTDATTPGTPAYMAPEQLTSRVSTPASDLYSFGCTLYEMLTGTPPFDGDTTFAVMTAHATATPDPVCLTRDDTPEPIENLVAHLLSKDPAGRPPNAESVLRTLLPYVDGQAPLPGAIDPAAAATPRHRYAQAVAALFPAPIPFASTAAAGAATTMNPSEATGLPPESTPETAAPDAAALLAAQLHLADRLFARSEFLQAAAAYQAAADQAVQTGSDTELRLDCEIKAATCLALAGQGRHALARLTQLLDEQRSILPAGDERLLNLRHQVGLMQWTCGQYDAARTGLRELHSQLERFHGPDHPLTRRVRADLDRYQGRP